LHEIDWDHPGFCSFFKFNLINFHKAFVYFYRLIYLYTLPSSTFHEFSLTQQEMVDGQPDLPIVLHSFSDWLVNERLIPADDGDCDPESSPYPEWIFVTCGDWDLKTALPTEAASLDLNLPRFFFVLSWTIA
jgi:hypothetical protein